MKIRPAFLTCFILCATSLAAQTVTTPEQQFGHIIGADYVLPNYQQLSAYWRKLDSESDRMIVQSMGKTAEGRDQLMAIITSPANHARLQRYKDFARKLALAEITETEARSLAGEGKAVVWIDGGLHATEVLGAQQLMETVYQLVSRSDPETLRILNDCIILAVHANPDGMDLVSDWYMRTTEPTKRSTSGVPRLYEKYAGHDNNRDSYMNALPETRNMSRIQFREWFPQIVYNHHQTGPTGSVLFAPPFRDPFNYNFDPLIPAQIDAIGAAMHSRFIVENKPGAVTRGATGYSTWWNGGVRTTVYFHNMIGLLTESVGNPTPMEIPFVLRFQQPNSNVFMPIEPQKQWHFRQSIDYSLTANYAVLDYASRYREEVLFNIWRMGRNSIERGSKDNWTVGAWSIDSIRKVAGRDTATRSYDVGNKYFQMLRNPAKRDARAYIIPSTQRDFPTATKFINALIMSGITVHRARAAFSAEGRQYPAGSYIVKTAQAFRPHVLDMFEPQQHPNDFQYPGGPPVAPYDNAGYTLALQMGVQFERSLTPVEGNFELLSDTVTTPARVDIRGNAAGYSFKRAQNDAFRVVNELLAKGYDVREYDDWNFVVRNKANLTGELTRIAQQTGISFSPERRLGKGRSLQPPRIALWDVYGGSTPSGWLRYVLDNFRFAYDVVYPPDIDAGNLRSKYDVIILPDGAVPDSTRERGDRDDSLPDVPTEWKARMGRFSAEKTLPSLRAFVESGGRLITIGGSNNIAKYLGVPVDMPRFKREEFYVPGSILQVSVDTTKAVARGLTSDVLVFFDLSPFFRVKPEATDIETVATYVRMPLRSGWAWGQEKLEGAAAVLDVKLGTGHLYMFGPEITFRSQVHGTYKFLFNALYAK